MEKFLITTALEETWLDNEPVLFLGEWCRIYSRQRRWAGMDAEVLPYHWDDQEKFYADYQYLGDFYERLLALLARRLNQIHNVDCELRYWRILIGPWLAYFIQILYDRWSSIQLALSRFEISGTIVLTSRDDAMAPNNMEHFTQLCFGDEWNHHLCAIILEQFTKVPCTRKTSEGHAVPSRRIELKYKIAGIYTKLASQFGKDRDAFLINTYLGIPREMRLHFRLGQFPQLWRSVPSVRVPVDWKQREWTMGAQGQTDFEIMTLALIPKHIPTLYLEGYRQLIEQTRKLPWPKRPKVIFTSNAAWHDTVSMAYIAEKAAQGIPLVYGQHGGVYGVAKFTWAEEHEIEISDRYLTWGWDIPFRPKVKPLGILKIPSDRKQPSVRRERLLFVTLDAPRYLYRLSSESLIPSNDYFNDAFLFTDNLPGLIQDKLLVRLTARETGWNQLSRWKDRFPAIELDPGRFKMNQLLMNARLVVYTYNSTGFLEAFARDIPTVLFWNPEISLLRDSAIPYFEELKRVGIFHESPKSAARHVAAIWNNVDAWWKKPAVRDVLKRFKERFCRLPEDLLDRLEATLREVMASDS